jgi:hypothetical protein
MVTADQARALRDFVDAYNARDWQRMQTGLASDCIYQEIARPVHEVQGARRIVEHFQAWAQVVPTSQVIVGKVIMRDDDIAMEFTLQGSQIGPFGDFGPTGKPQVVHGAVFATIGSAGITELRSYFDKLELFQVLGIQLGGSH